MPLFSSLLGLIAMVLAVPPALARETAPVGDDALGAVAARLEVRLGRRTREAEAFSEKLSRPVRRVLNDWAGTFAELELTVVLPEHAEAVLAGPEDLEDELREAAEDLDETWARLGEVLTVAEPAVSDRAVLVVLLDRDAYREGTWAAVLDAFAQRRTITASTAEALAETPTSLTMRRGAAFIQAAYDMAGNAAAGDDEFRLRNEVVHKFVQCAATARFGQIPETMLWGLGYVAEQRQFRSIYQFGRSGFVHAFEHFDWPKRTRTVLDDARRDETFSLAELATRNQDAAGSTVPQRATWAALDYLAHVDPEGLRALLVELGELHAEQDPYGAQPRYVGDADETLELIAQHFDAIDLSDLARHLKRVK